MKLLFPSIGYSRLRMETDGEGVTTLVCAQGCPLRCKYCINPESSHKRGRPRQIFTPQSLYQLVKTDALYFLATGGGIMFGGGEPLLYVDFIEAFSKLAPDWKIYCETSLWVSPQAIKKAARIVDHFVVDVKDTDSEIYRAYTGREFDRVGENLRLLLSLVGEKKITVRLPLIPDYNTDAHRDRSERLLRSWGVTKFERYDYVIKEK